MSTMVFDYGLRDPTVNAAAIKEQIRRAHRYRNMLTEIELERRAAVRAAMALHPEMAPLVERRAELVAKRDAARAEITGIRARARSRADTAAQRKATRELGLQLREVTAEIKDVRAAVLKDEGVKAALDAAELHSKERMKRARKASGVYWGTYQLQEADAARARMEPMPPKFRVWTHEGRVSAQLQNGREVKDLQDGTQFQIIPVEDTPEQRAKRIRHAAACGTVFNPANHKYAVARVRIGTVPGTNNPIWGEWPMKIHRQLPPGAAIKIATVALTKSNCSTFEWKLLLTVDITTSRWLYPLLAEVSVNAPWQVTAYYIVTGSNGRKFRHEKNCGVHKGVTAKAALVLANKPLPGQQWKFDVKCLIQPDTRLADLVVDFDKLSAALEAMHVPVPAGLRFCETAGDVERMIDALLRPIPEAGSAALNLGFSATQDGEIRAGYLVGSDGAEQEIRVPRNVIDAVKKADSIRSIRSKNLDEVRGGLLTWKTTLIEIHNRCVASAGAGDGWSRLSNYIVHAGHLPTIAMKMQSLHAWRSPERFRNLAFLWRESRFDGDTLGYEMIESWRYREQHLDHYECGLRRRALRRRREGYRILARKWATRYRTLVIDDTNLAVFQRSPKVESEHSEVIVVKSNQRLAAASELRRAMTNAYAKTVKYSSVNMTRRCSMCMHINDWGRPVAGRIQVCAGCQMGWDQDANADRNLLIEHARAVTQGLDDKPAVRRLSRSERIRAARTVIQINDN